MEKAKWMGEILDIFEKEVLPEIQKIKQESDEKRRKLMKEYERLVDKYIVDLDKLHEKIANSKKEKQLDNIIKSIDLDK